MSTAAKNFTVLTGRPGSGKTRNLIARFRDAVKMGVEDRVLFIVPDSVAREHIRDLLARDSTLAFSDSGVHSINSLVTRLAGQQSATSLHLQAFLRKSVADGTLDKSRYKILETSGGLELLENAVVQLRRAGHTVIPNIDTSNPLLNLLSDTLKLWDDWLQSSGKLDSIGNYDRAVEKALTENYELVIIDGFTEIQPLDWVLLKQILKNSTGAVAAVDPGQHPSEELLKQFKFLKFKEEPLGAAEGSICDDLSWLGDVASWTIDSAKPATCPENLTNDSVRVIRAGNPSVEASAVAREVAKFIKRGHAYSDIAVIAPNLREARENLSGAFKNAGIPIRFYIDVPLINTGPGAMMSAFLNLLAGDWDDDSVLKLITNPLAHIPEVEIRWAVDTVKSRSSINTREKWIKNAPTELSAFLKIISDLTVTPDLTPSKIANQIISELEIRIRTVWAETDDNITANEGWAWKKTKEALISAGKALDEVFGTVTLSEAVSFFFDQIQNASGRPFDRRSDCVNAVTMLSSRTWGVPVAIVMGLSSNNFPHRQTVNPFLPDILRSGINLPLPTYDELREREQSMFRVAITRARENLILTWPSGSLSGSPNRISTPLSLFLNWTKGEGTNDLVEVIEILPPSDLNQTVFISDVASAGFGHGLMDDDVLEKFKNEYGLDYPWPVDSSYYEDPTIIPPEDPDSFVLGTETNPISPTHLNNLAQCPFKFFASRILKLNGYTRDRVAAGFDYMVQGNIAHNALQEWFAGGKSQDFQTLVRNAVAKQKSILPDAVTQAHVAQIVDALERFKNFEEKFIVPTGFVQKYGEYEFNTLEKRRGEKNEAFSEPVKINLPHGREIILGGRIDRIDIKDENIAFIADYKRSGAREQKNLPSGLNLQLACYILLARSGLDLNVAVACFLPLNKITTSGAGKVIYDPELSTGFDSKNFKTSDDELSIENHLEIALEKIISLADRINQGDIKPDPTNKATGCGKKCSFVDLCRFKFSGFEGVGEGGDQDD